MLHASWFVIGLSHTFCVNVLHLLYVVGNGKFFFQIVPHSKLYFHLNSVSKLFSVCNKNNVPTFWTIRSS